MKSVEKILRWVVIGGIFLTPFVPLIVTDSMFFPFITGKNFAFRIIVEIIAMAWLALALCDVKYRPKRNWILGAFAIFVIIMAIADAQGANPMKSFWSNYERMDGWITIAHLLVYTTVAAAMINTEKLWQRLFDLTLGVSAYLSVFGFLEVAGVATLGTGGGLLSRIDVTFGNPIYLAVYMLFNIFIAALFIVQNGDHKWQRDDRIAYPGLLIAGIVLVLGASNPSSYWAVILVYAVFVAAVVALMRLPRKWGLYAIVIIDTIALFFTGTRGTILGLVGGALLTVILLGIFNSSRRMRTIAISSVVGVIVISGLLYAARDTVLVQKVGFLQRLSSISLHDDTIGARLINMQIAWKGVEERPVLGWGQENFAIVFDKYYDPRMYAQEQWFDRVHNIIFDWWIAGGTLGLLSYLSLLFATLWVLWKTRGFSVVEKSILTGLMAGYFIHNLTVFDNITSYILFGTVLGYICFRAAQVDGKKPIVSRKLLSGNTLPAVAVAAALLALGIVWVVNGNAYLENKSILLGLAQQNSLSANLSDFEQAIAYNTYGNQEAREQLVQIASSVATASGVSDDVKQQFFQEAASQMQLQEKVSPLDARFPLFLGVLEDSYGDYADAQTSLMQAQALSPDKQSILFELALNEQAQGNVKQAEQTFKQAYELDTADTQAAIYYAAEAIRASDDSAADQILAPLIPTGAAADPSIAQAYAARDEYAKIIPIWQAYVAANPTDAQGYMTLAAAYYQLKENAKAIAVMQALAQAIPADASQAQELIQEIQSGTASTQ